MTLKRHPDVLALVALVAICGAASRRAASPSFALSAVPYRIEHRSTLLCERTESMMDAMQTKLDQAVERLTRRVEGRSPRIFGL